MIWLLWKYLQLSEFSMYRYKGKKEKHFLFPQSRKTQSFQIIILQK